VQRLRRVRLRHLHLPAVPHAAIEECIEGAQQGGVGLIAYSRKEGRALGEVTKFLVYNARKRQEGGDRADKYFLRTECVAGVPDMRFPGADARRAALARRPQIHRLVSMSTDKYDAITGSGIEVGEAREDPRRAGAGRCAGSEIEAKIAAGYFTDGHGDDRSSARRSEGARACLTTPSRRCATLRQSASAATTLPTPSRQANRRTSRWTSSSSLRSPTRVAALARRRFPDGRIPYHSRWRHFEAGGVNRAAELDVALAGRGNAERARARIDLALVSVLLDAGAGADWRYAEAQSAQRFARSEGLGVASFRGFMAGRFFVRCERAVPRRCRCADRP